MQEMSGRRRETEGGLGRLGKPVRCLSCLALLKRKERYLCEDCDREQWDTTTTTRERGLADNGRVREEGAALEKRVPRRG